MKLTEELKKKIDSMSISELLSKIRFSPLGSELFLHSSGDYIMDRYNELRKADPEAHTKASKDIGW